MVEMIRQAQTTNPTFIRSHYHYIIMNHSRVSSHLKLRSMASTLSPLNRTLSLPPVRNTSSSCKAHATKPSPAFPINALSGRRQLLFFLTASTVVTAREPTAMAQDIPLFGFRKNLRKAEEAAEEIVREGFEAADKGLVTAERGLVTAERGIEAAEEGIEAAEREISDTLSFGGLAQAGVVAGAEVFGVLVATAVVNGILGPEAQKS